MEALVENLGCADNNLILRKDVAPCLLVPHVDYHLSAKLLSRVI